MLTTRNGNMFDTTLDAVGHGANTFGLMGAGVAAQVRSRFPGGYSRYRQACRDGDLTPGGAQVLPPEETGGRWLVNIASQDRPGRHARMHWIETGLRVALTTLADSGVRGLAIPEIGCGIGGLALKDLLPVLQKVADAHPDVNLELWSPR